MRWIGVGNTCPTPLDTREARMQYADRLTFIESSSSSLNHLCIFFPALSRQLNTDMLNTLRALNKPSLTSFSLYTRRPPLPNSQIRFAQAASDSGEMDPKKHSEPESKPEDAMSSFGDGYATRSDEEGFGGIYGGNQSVSKDKDGKDVDTGFNHDQGSEVKEKEKARNQSKVGN